MGVLPLELAELSDNLVKKYPYNLPYNILSNTEGKEGRAYFISQSGPFSSPFQTI